MDDKTIHQHINELVAEEHRLREALQNGELSAAEEHAKLKAAEEALDQSWDLLRQREARRNAGESPDQAQTRPVDEVEQYRQ
jgi:septal ring factor EnvC (AmiA/AmiB activator)